MRPPVATTTYSAYRKDWLSLHDEPVIEPDLPIIDAHHHVWDAPRPRYMPEQLIADLASGHRIVATVYVDCRSMYRATGPVHLRAVGEVEFARGVAAMGRSGAYGPARLCEAIVSHVDLRRPEAEEALIAMIAAGGGHFGGSDRFQPGIPIRTFWRRRPRSRAICFVSPISDGGLACCRSWD